MLLDICWIFLGLVLLYYGAEWLVKGSSELAIRLGISPLVIGLTVVAFGTSAPELVVSIKANWSGQGGMAIGNVIGSNICNICLVLGIGAAIFPLAIHRQVIRREMPILLVATIVFSLMLRNGEIERWEAAILAVGIIFYVIFSLIEARSDPGADCSEEVPPEMIEEVRKSGTGRIFYDLLLIILGAVLLVAGADRMVYGGEHVARAFGVSEAVIGLTLFAFGTSLPELATSVVAAMKKQGDIIVGNAVGSCIFNLLAVVGIAGLVAPLKADGVTVIHIGVMLGAAIILMPMMWHRMKLDRWEGLLLFVGYLGFVGWLVSAS